MNNPPTVTLENVTKRYSGVTALENANFELYPGEIHALVGENGAGKSTLCKLIAGVISPTEGRLSVDGRPVAFSAPKDATRLGIAMVFQETSLVPQLTVAQNMVLGRERAFNSVRKVRNTARQALQRLNFNVDPSQLAGALSAAKRQMVEIARAVLNDARVIIFDEPTAALTPEETEHLFDLMKTLRRRRRRDDLHLACAGGGAEHADRITVLRNGRLMVTGPASDFDRASLIRHMIGEELAQRQRPPAEGAPRLPPRRCSRSRTSAWARWSTTCRSPCFRARSRGSPASSAPDAAKSPRSSWATPSATSAAAGSG